VNAFVLAMIFLGAFLIGATIGLALSNRRVLRKIEFMELESRITEVERRVARW